MPYPARRLAIRGGVALLGLSLVLALSAWWFVVPSGPDEPELTGTLERSSVHSGDRARHWLTYRPTRTQRSPALLVVLHGSSQDGAGMRAATGYRFDELAEQHGFVVVYPDGVDGNWNECRRGGDFTAKREDVDDVGLVRTVVSELEDVGIDPARVFVTGYSSGGQMALRLALEAPELVAGIAPVAANVPTPENSRCTDLGTPVPALFIAGTDDPMNPYDGGEVALFGRFGSRGTVLGAVEGAASFAVRNGGSSDASVEDLPERDGDDDTAATLRTWDSPTPVRLVTVEGGGHHYPSPGHRGPRFLGPSAHDVDGPETVVRFFGLDAPPAAP